MTAMADTTQIYDLDEACADELDDDVVVLCEELLIEREWEPSPDVVLGVFPGIPLS